MHFFLLVEEVEGKTATRVFFGCTRGPFWEAIIIKTRNGLNRYRASWGWRRFGRFSRANKGRGGLKNAASCDFLNQSVGDVNTGTRHHTGVRFVPFTQLKWYVAVDPSMNVAGTCKDVRACLSLLYRSLGFFLLFYTS